MNRYRLSENELLKLIEIQNNKCAICKRELNKSITDCNNKSLDLCVDHCHNSKQVRGLLCRDCNLALGMFKDSIEFLKNAINYITNE